MNSLLKDILHYTSSGESITVTRQSVLEAIDPIKEARENKVTEMLATSFIRDTDPLTEFKKWCNAFDLEFIESTENYNLIHLRRNQII